MAGMRPLTKEEQGLVLAGLDRMRDRVLFLTGLYTGFRISELLSLRVADVWKNDEPGRAVTVSRRHLKGGAGPHASRLQSRSVALHPMLRAAIATYLAPRFEGRPVDGLEVLFPSRKGRNQPIRPGQAWHVIKQAAGRVGAERVATHSLRKSFARSVYESTGHDLVVTQRALGHRSILTTARYLDASEPEVCAAVMAIEGPVLAGRAPTPVATPTHAAISFGSMPPALNGLPI